MSTNCGENWGPIAKVLVVRLDGIGDALVCTPLLAALLDAGHTVGIALSDRNRDVFAPGVFAAVHVLERIPWPRHGSTPDSSLRARGQIAAAGYDVALIVSEEPEAYELAGRIPRRIGFTTGWSKPLKTVWARAHLTRSVVRGGRIGSDRAHEVEVVFRLANRSGLHAEAVPTRDAARLRPLILEEPPAGPEPGGEQFAGQRIVVQLGRKWSAIGIDDVSARAIVAALAARGARMVVSAAEEASAVQFGAGSALRVCRSVACWKQEIARARIVVTPDTGAAHLAGMLGIPVVDCFPDADASVQIARWHPWAARYAALVSGELRGPHGVRRLERAVDAL